jgi:hypothetical protein
MYLCFYMYAFVNSVIEAILSETTSAPDGARRQLIAQLYVTVIQRLPGAADVARQAGGDGGASGQLHGMHREMCGAVEHRATVVCLEIEPEIRGNLMVERDRKGGCW